MRDIKLALWGPSAAGKTALLAQLYIQSRKLPGDWEIYPTQKSKPFIDRLRPIILRENLFPAATSVGSEEQIVYLFRHRTSGAEASLSVEDRAGKDSETLDDAGRERLAGVDGLVLLFDPVRDGAELQEQVLRTLEGLFINGHKGGGKDRRPIAVCLSKADLLIHQPVDARSARLQPDAFVRERMVADLGGWIELFCANYRLFPISAAGVRMKRGVVEPVVFYDERLQLRIGQGGEPVNLIEPFLWIFEQLEGQP
jgi:GTPase SAR1 family protein